MKFVLEIDKMAYDAMQTPDEVAAAIREIADRMEGDTLPARASDPRPIHDVNGNTVGTWAFVDEKSSLTTTLSTGYKLYPDSNETGEELRLIGDDGVTREELFTTTEPRVFRDLGESLIAAASAAETEKAERDAIASRVATATKRIETEGMF